jgi:hypothetical protein
MTKSPAFSQPNTRITAHNMEQGGKLPNFLALYAQAWFNNWLSV